MSKSMEELDSLFAGLDLGPAPEKQRMAVVADEQPKALSSVESAAAFLRSTGELALGLDFKLSA